MFTLHRSKRIGFNSFVRLSKSPFKPNWSFVAAFALLALIVAATPAHPDALNVSDPVYNDCGNVWINGGVDTDPVGIVWDWGDGSKSTSWFPATHRYSTNGTYTVKVTAAGCNTLTETTIAEIINVEDPPNCPPAGTQIHYYLVPYNMHLTAGATSAVPLHVVDQDGIAVSGTLAFTIKNPPAEPLVSISSSGVVTALRTEAPSEIGIWVSAALNGQEVSNTCVVRVLPNDYSTVSFAEAVTARTSLYYPTMISGEDINAAVNRFKMDAVNEYAYQIQARLMGTSPFQGGRQIFEVDFGTTEENRVCGISGNPIRLGWNIVGDVPGPEWRNCFLVPWPPFWPDRSPQWGVIFHELGHNMT
jgi:PKD repeat protein